MVHAVEPYGICRDGTPDRVAISGPRHPRPEHRSCPAEWLREVLAVHQSSGHVQLELEEGQLRGLPDGLAHHECVDERHVHEVVEEALVVPTGLGQNPKKNIVELKTE